MTIAFLFGFIASILPIMLSWAPLELSVICIVLIGLAAIVIVIKLVAFILDAIPFL